MRDKAARADVAHIRQTTQFTCCAASIASALKALGKHVTEDDVNKVLGAAPMAGATWEAMLATVQYFGCRGTLVVPATPRMIKAWTDQGIPVVIAWNPEGRPWSHASTVFDVQEDAAGKLTVYVMDSNIPNPEETVRVLDADTFCQKWGEKVSDTLIVRRPAMAVTLEVDVQGRQVVASKRTAAANDLRPGDLKAGDKVRGTGNLSSNVAGPWGKVDKNDRYQSEAVEGRSTGKVVEVKRGGAFDGWPAVKWDGIAGDPVLVNPANLAVTTPGRMAEILATRRGPTVASRTTTSPQGTTMKITPGMIQRVADAHEAKSNPNQLVIKKEDLPKNRLGPEFVTTRRPGGPMQNRTDDVERGRSRTPKHKKPWGDE